MIKEKQSKWLTQSLSRKYLEGIRSAIPLANTQISVICKIIHAWCPNLKMAIDLGCGDGVLGKAILDDFPNARVLFIDFSDPMLDAARQKIRSDSAQFIKADFSSPFWLESLEDYKDFDLIVSGFSIHHQSDKRKRELYSEIYQLLVPEGVFLNLEHVLSASDAINAIFDEYFIDHLYEFHVRSDKSALRQEIAEKYYARDDKKEDVLASVGLQCEWLSQIGFKDVDCFFKIFELALFGGRK